MTTIFIALGTNLGDRAQNLAYARELLLRRVKITRFSSVYETEPWGVTDQPKFYNQVVEAQTDLKPKALLRFLKEIEKDMGRKTSVRYGPRLIDLDILLYGMQQVNTPDLVIPHPRLVERAFVLVPLTEIAPSVVIPGTGLTAAEILVTLDTTGVIKMEESR